MLQVLDGKVAWEISLLSPIYLFNNLFMSAEAYGYFIIWVTIQNYCIDFVPQIVLAWAVDNSFIQLLCPFDIVPSLGIFF